MLRPQDTLSLAVDALRAHRLRSALTILGLMIGVATLITVVTIVQGANVYVETKIANLGSDVFQLSRMPFAVTDFDVIRRAQRFKRILWDDYLALRDLCFECTITGATGRMTTRAQYRDVEVPDVTLTGQTPSMAQIDSSTVELGRYFTDVENTLGRRVCLIGYTLKDRFFPDQDPLGRVIKLEGREFTVIGLYEKNGAVLGQDADNFAVIPLNTFLDIRGRRASLTINVKVPGDPARFERAMDQARLILRARRHVAPNQEEDFFVGTKDSYIKLWNQISGAFFAVFILVSSISAVVGGIVIMNVMLVSVTQRTSEIGVRRAVGASATDILRQFLAESVLQCLLGGLLGIGLGFLCAELLDRFTSFPAAVQGRVAVLGIVLASSIGLFFGIYPATRAARLDPVVALRSE